MKSNKPKARLTRWQKFLIAITWSMPESNKPVDIELRPMKEGIK